MSTTTRLNYDELTTIAKKFHDESEDAAQILSSTRQKMATLRNEWVGAAADKFFEEMEGELLPAVKRLSLALIASQDAVNNIMKTIHEADSETASFFKDGIGGGDDFGAGKFGEALGNPATSGGVEGSAGGLPGGDASQGGLPGSDPTNPAGAQDPANPSGYVSAKEMAPFQTPEAEAAKPADPAAEAAAAGAGAGGGGGGGGGGASGQGLQGDLKSMGVGMEGAPAQSSSVGSAAGGAESLPDHSFGGAGGAAGAADGGPQTPAGAGSAGGGTTTSNEGGGGAAAAGAAGIAGSAAVGAAAKVLKGNQDKK